MAEIKVKLAQTHQGIGGVSIEQNNQGVGVSVNSGGLSEVIHDETLKGRGTNANPLGIADDVLQDIDYRVEKTYEADKVYGTDSQGEQTTYNVDSFGKVDDVKVNGTSVVTNKVANISVPTAVSQLTNDADYQTGIQVNTAISEHNTSNVAHDDIRQLISGLNEWETASITATTTNYQLNHTYSISEAFQRAADLFEGHWNAITSINDVIPSQATAQNQLADKNFVNSSIASNAANFRGNWETWADVPTVASDYPEDYVGNRTPANNDYMVIDDAEDYGSEYTGSWRFIYIGDWDTDGKAGWLPAYRIGHAFTAAQWAAINSNITATMVSDYIDPTSQVSTAYNLRITALESDKRDVINASYKIYATDANGDNLDTLGYSQTATASTIAQRDANGELAVATPTQNTSATTKLYVDTLAGTKQDKLNTTQMSAVNSNITAAKVTSYDNHLSDTNNPHQVTKAQVGLGNVDNTSDLDKPISTATQAVLTAQQEEIDALSGRGRFLSIWNCATGLPETDPEESPYTYKTGDYFIVGVVSTADPTVNYKPDGSSYTTGVASTVVETGNVGVDDVYLYDGTNWLLQINTQKTVTFSAVAGSPYDNTNLGNALDAKANSADLATVATTGDYDDLLNKPTIPTVNDATLTIQKNGTNVATFTANASSGVTANISVPTDTNDLTNGAGYITGITSGDVTTALGYTPYSDTNPNGYTSNVGTVTSVNNINPNSSGNISLSVLNLLTAGTDLEIVSLPLGYTELEYIDGTGLTQYINTGLMITPSMNFYFKAAHISGAGVDSYFGTRNSTTTQNGVMFRQTSTAITVDFFGVTGTRWTINHTRQDNAIIEFRSNNLLAEVLINGTSLGTNQFTAEASTLLYPLLIKALNNGGSPALGDSGIRIYRFTIEGVCDLIPARRNSDNVAGMYDVVRNQFFPSSGSGSFTGGNSVNPVINFTNDTGYITSADLPTVNNPTITITQGGVTKGSFTLNQASGDTIALDAGGGGGSYTAGSGIDITSDVISVDDLDCGTMS